MVVAKVSAHGITVAVARVGIETACYCMVRNVRQCCTYCTVLYRGLWRTLLIRLINSRTGTARSLGLGVMQLYKTVEAEDTVIGVRKEQRESRRGTSAASCTGLI